MSQRVVLGWFWGGFGEVLGGPGRHFGGILGAKITFSRSFLGWKRDFVQNYAF